MKLWMFVLLALGATAVAEDLAALCADRAAIERVYYNHRLGDKPPFEQALPSDLIERLVRTGLRKEAVLRKVYRVERTPAQIEAEVRRINSTTRAPAVLAELMAALANDPARFARTVARPIVVERLLRAKFENDDTLHAAQRREAEKIRGQLLTTRSSRGDEAQTSSSQLSTFDAQPDGRSLLTSAATNGVVERLVAIMKDSHSNAVTESPWRLGVRPVETNAPAADEIEIKNRFGPNAQVLSSPQLGGEERKLYFEDLPPELQKVLRVQLRQVADVSAVIETPGGFLLYVATGKTDAVLSVAGLSLPKRGYEQWLEEQNQGAE